MYDNPLLVALFSESSKPPSSRLAHVRSLFNISSGLVVMVPSIRAALQIDPALLEQDHYVLSHVAQLPPTVRDYRKGTEVSTLSSSVVHLSETHITPKRGFPSQDPILIRVAYPWNPGVKYISQERLIIIIELDGPLIVPEPPRRFFRGLTSQSIPPPTMQSDKKDLEQIIGHKKGPRAKTSAILGPLLLGFKIPEFTSAEAMGLAFRSMVQSATKQLMVILDPSIPIADAVQEYFEYQAQIPILEQLKVILASDHGSLVLYKMHAKLQYLDLAQLDLPDINRSHYNLVMEVSRRLAILESFHTIDDSILIVLESMEALGSHGISADSLIGLLLYTVIKSPFKFSDITPTLIRHFCKESINPDIGKLGYALLTLESVFIHLREVFPRLEGLSHANEQFWFALKRSNYDDMKAAIKYDTSVARSAPNGFDCLFYSIRQRNGELFRHLVKSYPNIFTPQYIFEDRDATNATLLFTAIESYDRVATDSILDIITEAFDEGDQRHFFEHVDDSGRSIAHLIHYNDTIIAKIGHLLDWSRRDHSGLTPLLVLSGCYDHIDYDGMISLAISKWNQQTKAKPSLHEHINNKGNSLLHIISPQSSTIIGKLAKISGIDVDIPNDKGRTPLMVAAKYDRIDFVDQLLELNASLWQVDLGGMSVFDHAKGKSLKAVYHATVERSALQVEVRSLRATANNSHSMITLFHSNGRAVYRTSEDFLALSAILESNYPFSWVPPVRLESDIALDPWKLSRSMMRKTAYNTDYFISLLQYHETFKNCEEVQEFCYAEGHFEPEKHSGNKSYWQKRQNPDGTKKLSYSDQELDQIITFFEFSINQLKSFMILYAKFSLCASRVEISHFSMRELIAYCSDLVRAEFIKDVINEHMVKLQINYLRPPNISEDPAPAIIMCEAHSTASLIEALERPIAMIAQLRQVKKDLEGHRDTLYELGESKSWPMLYFEDKRTKAIQDEEAKILESRNKIRDLTNSISGSHYALASELGSYAKFRSDITMDLVKIITERHIRRSKHVLTALEIALHRGDKHY